MPRFALAAAVALSLTLSGASALADPTGADRETARALMDDADKKIEAKDYTGALKSYEGADALMSVPTTGIEVARTLVLLGRFIEAREKALEVLRFPKKTGESKPFSDARNEAEQLASKLAQRIPSLHLIITPADLKPTVQVDGVVIPAAALTLPRKVDPGKHVIGATAKGFVPITLDVRVGDGETGEVTLAFKAEDLSGTPIDNDANGRPARSPLVYVGFGLGGAGLLVGAITGIVSLSKTSTVKDACPTKTCPLSVQPTIDSAKTFGTVSTIGFIAGGAGIGLGVLGLFLSSPAAKKPTASSWRGGIAPSPVGVSGWVSAQF